MHPTTPLTSCWRENAAIRLLFNIEPHALCERKLALQQRILDALRIEESIDFRPNIGAADNTPASTLE
jgi:hypothetical protein